jgi:enoyl-CoA hydratase/carnithine racemase
MPDLIVDQRGAVTVLTINRPGSMNAFTHQVVAQLTAAMEEFGEDETQLAAIITGAGDKAFCVGADLKEMAGDIAGAARLPVTDEPDICGIAACEKPTIAAINGLALAGGLELALCCDIRVASATAWFALPEVKLGLIPGLAVTTLPRLLPMGAALDLVMSGERMPADEALRLGLVQRVVGPGELLDVAVAKAETIAANSPTAVWGAKKALRYYRDLQLAEAQRYYEAIAHRVMLAGDLHEGPRSFVEKRSPSFAPGWPSPLADEADRDQPRRP